MHSAPRATRRPSPFVAAVLSLLFPGLGQLYVGRPARALAFAAAPILAIGLTAGLLANHDARQVVIASLFAPAMLQALLIVDVLALGYRAVSVVDACRLALASEAGDEAGTKRRQALPRPLPIAGLLAVLLVLALGHVALARYDRIAYDTITGITSTSPIAEPVTTGPTPGPSATAAPSGSAALTTPAPVAWNGTGRLNVLLIGSDQRPPSPTFNTDTMIVASIDPSSGQVAMFSVPRDTENVPLAAGTPAAAYFPGGVYPNRINSLWSFASGSPGLFPGPAATRGASALKGALGELLGIDIQYYVMVNFTGFRTVVDTLGGAMIDVQLPVSDYDFPATDTSGLKLYIPPGIQYMTGTQALMYARARHQTNDFDRSQRQQRVVTSLRQQTDVLSFLDPNRLELLSTALRSAIHTDYPAANLPALISLIEKVDLTHLRSFVFTPPTYQTECALAQCRVHYFIHPKVAVIQQVVRAAFTVDPAVEKARQALASEGATVWVLGGSKDSTQAGRIADYLDYLGVDALVPAVHGGRAPRTTYAATVITVYNGAEARLPETIRVLQATFGVTIVTASDPAMKADVVVITGAKTPNLQVPVQ